MLDKGVFVLSKSKAVEQYNIVRGLCDCVSYSFKTNPDVGRVLEEGTDCSFCVHSVEALEMIKDKKRVWFFAQAWDACEIEGLLRDGVLSFVVDNVEDLNVFVDYIGEKKVKGKKEAIMVQVIQMADYLSVLMMKNPDIISLSPEECQQLIEDKCVHVSWSSPPVSPFLLQQQVPNILEKASKIIEGLNINIEE